MKKLLILMVLLTSVFVLASCESKDTLKVFIWGEYIDESLVELFEETYDVNVDIIIFESNEAAVLQVKSSKFDIIVPTDYAIEELAAGDYLQEIDWTRFENVSQDDFSEDYLSLLNQIEDFAVEGKGVLDYAVPYFWGNIGIIYNTDVVTKEAVEAAGWNILANKDLNVMFYDIGRDATMIALRALYGQSMNPNLATDAQLEAAEQWLKDAKGPNTQYLTTEIYDVFLEPATIDVAHAFSGEAIYLLPENPNLGYYVPTSGTNVWTDMLAIPKNANNTDLAYLFIDFFMSYEHGLTNSEMVGYTSPRADVAAEIVRLGVYGPEYQVQVRAYDQIHRFDADLKTKIEQLWSRVRAQ
jgi:spermidine/putrescine transport system substrate-binding protein